jgi:hypothetical protein
MSQSRQFFRWKPTDGISCVPVSIQTWSLLLNFFISIIPIPRCMAILISLEMQSLCVNWFMLGTTSSRICERVFFCGKKNYDTSMQNCDFCDYFESHIYFETKRSIQSNSVITTSAGPLIFVRYNHEALCSKVTICDQKFLKIYFVTAVNSLKQVLNHQKSSGF